MTLQEKIVEKYLDRAVAEFDTNPLSLGFLRRMANETPELFFPAAMKHLRSNETGNAHRFLTVLAMRFEELTNYLVSPSLGNAEAATKLFRRFLAVDPSFDVKLARKLPDRGYTNHASAFDVTRSTRALEILDRTSSGRRLLPILGHLPDASDPSLAAKATLFVGRRLMNPAWTAKLLSRPEDRVRANAVETLWGLKTPLALELLEGCAEDRNNRVTGNALLGLHIAGHAGVDAGIKSLARTGDPDRRSTAAWVMGRLAHERWVDPLTLMVKDDAPQVRSTALRALMEIRRHESPAHGAGGEADVGAAQSGEDLPEVQGELIKLASPGGILAENPESRTPESHGAELRVPEIRLDGSSFRARPRFRSANQRVTM